MRGEGHIVIALLISHMHCYSSAALCLEPERRPHTREIEAYLWFCGKVTSEKCSKWSATAHRYHVFRWTPVWLLICRGKRGENGGACVEWTSQTRLSTFLTDENPKQTAVSVISMYLIGPNFIQTQICIQASGCSRMRFTKQPHTLSLCSLWSRQGQGPRRCLIVDAFLGTVQVRQLKDTISWKCAKQGPSKLRVVHSI